MKVTAQIHKNQVYIDNKQSEVKTIPLIIALIENIDINLTTEAQDLSTETITLCGKKINEYLNGWKVSHSHRPQVLLFIVKITMCSEFIYRFNTMPTKQ